MNLPIDRNTDVVVVGGGPIGLWTAIQAKERNPDINITVLEKYDSYQRKHPLVIQPSSFKGAAISPKLQLVLDELKKTKTVRTTTIENLFEKHARDLGIRILKNNFVRDPSQLYEIFKNAKVIVGADGARSTVRQHLFDGKVNWQRDLNYICEVKYDVEATVDPLTSFETLPEMKMSGTLTAEHIGREKGNKVPVSLRFFVDKTTYKEIEDATHKSPYTLDSPHLPPALKTRIEHWLESRKVKKNEKKIESSIKITSTRLSTYKSASFFKRDEERDVNYFLVGDAAFGVPYFRSLNNGLISGIQLGKTIGSYFKTPKESRTPQPFHAYNKQTLHLAQWEICVANVKSLAILYFRFSLYVSYLFSKTVHVAKKKMLQPFNIYSKSSTPSQHEKPFADFHLIYPKNH